MKKVLCIVFAIMLAVACLNPIYAAEQEAEVVAVETHEEATTLKATPYLKVPKLPQISTIRITPKLNYNIDFSKYIPKITLN